MRKEGEVVRPTSACTRRRYASSKIGSILIAGIGSTAFPFYQCGAGDAPLVGPLHEEGSMPHTSQRMCLLAFFLLSSWISACEAVGKSPTSTPTITPPFTQGIQGDVVITAPLPGVDPRPGSRLEVVANESGTTHRAAHTFTDSQGHYTLDLSAGTYDVCVNSRGIGVDRPCTTNVVVVENHYIIIHLGVAMQ
jgi:hypothetical protein